MLRFCYLIINSRVRFARLRDRFCMCNKFSFIIITWGSFKAEKKRKNEKRSLPHRNWLIEGWKFSIRSAARRLLNQCRWMATTQWINYHTHRLHELNSNNRWVMNKNENENFRYFVRQNTWLNFPFDFSLRSHFSRKSHSTSAFHSYPTWIMNYRIYHFVNWWTSEICTKHGIYLIFFSPNKLQKSESPICGWRKKNELRKDKMECRNDWNRWTCWRLGSY